MLPLENPTAQTAGIPPTPEPPPLSPHTIFELRQLMQWYETQLLAHPEYADTFKEYLAIAAAADAIKREHATLLHGSVVRRRGLDGISGGPFLTLGSHRAIQSEPRSPPSYPEAAAQSDELVCL